MYTGQPSRNQNRDFEGSSKLVETARNYGGFATETKGPSGNKVCILARAPGGQMRGAATQAMPVCIVEERQQSRCPPAAAPLRAAARRPAGFVARSSHTAPGIARRSRLASGPGGLQQNVNLFLREP